ncbi:MAG: PKD domain-containing protein [Methanoregula sp.]|nr:PKD domain-containing protein [Methanoregula sp.]
MELRKRGLRIMEITLKKIWLIIIVCIFSAGILLSVFFFNPISSTTNEKPLEKNPVFNGTKSGEIVSANFESPLGNVVINASAPPSSIPFYRATVRDGDVIYKALGDVMSPKENVTSEQDAPEVAEKVMKQYGGLPPDAVFAWSETNYLEHQTGSGEVISKKPVTTTVAFGRRVNGISLDGDTDGIRIELGSNGKLLEFRKTWRTLTYSGNVSIIPKTKAVENFELTNHVGVLIDTVVLRYYETGDSNTYLEPVWVFIGERQPGGNRLKYIINAWQFADFSVMPVTVLISEPVSFTDASQTAAVKWYWEFGDGTNSTFRNTTHSYLKDGNYTVNLTVWNDLGSDTISKSNYIMVLPISSPHIDTTSTNRIENQVTSMSDDKEP